MKPRDLRPWRDGAFDPQSLPPTIRLLVADPAQRPTADQIGGVRQAYMQFRDMVRTSIVNTMSKHVMLPDGTEAQFKHAFGRDHITVKLPPVGRPVIPSGTLFYSIPYTEARLDEDWVYPPSIDEDIDPDGTREPTFLLTSFRQGHVHRPEYAIYDNFRDVGHTRSHPGNTTWFSLDPNAAPDDPQFHKGLVLSWWGRPTRYARGQAPFNYQFVWGGSVDPLTNPYFDYAGAGYEGPVKGDAEYPDEAIPPNGASGGQFWINAVQVSLVNVSEFEDLPITSMCLGRQEDPDAPGSTISVFRIAVQFSTFCDIYTLRANRILELARATPSPALVEANDDDYIGVETVAARRPTNHIGYQPFYWNARGDQAIGVCNNASNQRAVMRIDVDSEGSPSLTTVQDLRRHVAENRVNEDGTTDFAHEVTRTTTGADCLAADFIGNEQVVVSQSASRVETYNFAWGRGDSQFGNYYTTNDSDTTGSYVPGTVSSGEQTTDFAFVSDTVNSWDWQYTVTNTCQLTINGTVVDSGSATFNDSYVMEHKLDLSGHVGIYQEETEADIGLPFTDYRRIETTNTEYAATMRYSNDASGTGGSLRYTLGSGDLRNGKLVIALMEGSANLLGSYFETIFDMPVDSYAVKSNGNRIRDGSHNVIGTFSHTASWGYTTSYSEDALTEFGGHHVIERAGTTNGSGSYSTSLTCSITAAARLGSVWLLNVPNPAGDATATFEQIGQVHGSSLYETGNITQNRTQSGSYSPTIFDESETLDWTEPDSPPASIITPELRSLLAGNECYAITDTPPAFTDGWLTTNRFGASSGGTLVGAAFGHFPVMSIVPLPSVDGPYAYTGPGSPVVTSSFVGNMPGSPPADPEHACAEAAVSPNGRHGWLSYMSPRLYAAPAGLEVASVKFQRWYGVAPEDVPAHPIDGEHQFLGCPIFVGKFT